MNCELSIVNCSLASACAVLLGLGLLLGRFLGGGCGGFLAMGAQLIQYGRYGIGHAVAAHVAGQHILEYRLHAVQGEALVRQYVLTLDDAIALNSDIPFDMGVYFIKHLNYGENSIKFVNLGDFYSKPIFEFSSGPQNITCGFGDKRIMVEDVSTDVIIDMDRCIVTDGEGNNLLNKMQGKFFEFPSGVSPFNIYVDAECELKIRYIPKTIYDFDFSRIDWGDEGA